jgi:hypothetical protein
MWQSPAVYGWLIFSLIYIVLGALDGDKIFPEHDALRPWYHVHQRRKDAGLDFNSIKFNDGVPFLFTNKITKFQAIFCLHPKAGSTNFKFLFRYGNMNFGRHPTYMSLDEILKYNPHGAPASSLKHLSSAIAQAHLPRFMIVRNPYVRLLSGFLDKIVKEKRYRMGPPDYKPYESFDVFVDRLIYHQKYNVKDEDFNNHFRLMSGNCLVHANMTYDYYLPLEQMQYWYEPLMQALDLIPMVQQGWNVTTTQFFGSPDTPCFYKAPNRTCDDMFRDYAKRYAKGYYKEYIERRKSFLASKEQEKMHKSSTTRRRMEEMTVIPHHSLPEHNNQSMNSTQEDHTATISTVQVDKKSQHATGSITQLAQYFNTADLIDRVTRWVMPDLIEYHYPIWYGNMTAEEYLEEVFSFPYPSPVLEERR